MNGFQFPGDGDGKKTARGRLRTDRPVFGRVICFKIILLFYLSRLAVFENRIALAGD